MPYCPKCDMEFVEGIRTCTDCGQTLYESREAALAAIKQEEENQFRELMAQSLEELAEKAPRPRPKPAVYVKKSARCQDMKSSAYAFLLIGGFALALSLIGLFVLIPAYTKNHPASYSNMGNHMFSSSIMFYIGAGLLCCFGLICLFVCLKTNQAADQLKQEADVEAEETNKRITQFLNAHSAKEIDGLLTDGLSAFQELEHQDTPEEFVLKRYELIQDLLITEQDLPDPGYVDYLCEEIYNSMYGQEE